MHWTVTFLAVLVAAWALPTMLESRDLLSLAIFALVLAVLNALVRPLLILLTLPLSCLTLGLFTLVINALVFWFGTIVAPGVHVAGFVEAFFAALVVSVASTIIGVLIH
ncbi:MAG: phage holin family protein [Chloroflexi bacterium]|nr:phage holin family protein [Chloroflexota bacterium]